MQTQFALARALERALQERRQYPRELDEFGELRAQLYELLHDEIRQSVESAQRLPGNGVD